VVIFVYMELGLEVIMASFQTSLESFVLPYNHLCLIHPLYEGSGKCIKIMNAPMALPFRQEDTHNMKTIHT
jgi:hypothetical protein